MSQHGGYLAARSSNWCRGRAIARLEEAGFEVVAERFHRIPAGGPVGRAVRWAGYRVAKRATVRMLGGWSLVVLAREQA